MIINVFYLWLKSSAHIAVKIAPIAICITLLYALWQADEVVTQLEYDLNVSNTAIMVCKAENKRLREENAGLRKSNSCLMTNGKNCSKGILATPLPKLVKERK